MKEIPKRLFRIRVSQEGKFEGSGRCGDYDGIVEASLLGRARNPPLSEDLTIRSPRYQV